MPTAVLMMIGQIEVMKITKIADGLASPTEQADRRELAQIVDELLGQIPDEQRTTFLMHHYSGLSLPEAIRQEAPTSVTWVLWALAEVVAIATDLAEFLGAAVGLYLLFGIPLFPAALLASGFSRP